MEQKLNCWPGCNAIVVRSTLGNLGKIVRVERLAQPREVQVCQDGVTRLLPKEPTWITDIPLIRMCAGKKVMANSFPDGSLLPLRDDEGQDEMLRIVGLPKNVAEGSGS